MVKRFFFINTLNYNLILVFINILVRFTNLLK